MNMIGSEHEAWKMFKHPDPKSLLFVLKKPPSCKQPHHMLTPSSSLNGNTFSTDKALFGRMSCHPDRAWGGCTLPQATEKTSLRRSTSVTSHSIIDSDNHSRPLSSSSPSTSDGLLKSLPQWSRKGRRGGRGAAVSASLSSSAAAASSASYEDSSSTAKEDKKKKKKKRKEKEEVEMDPELESLRRLLMLAVDSHRQSSPKFSSPPRPIGYEERRVLTGAPPQKKHRTMALPLTLPPAPLPLKKFACGDNATAAANLSSSDDDRNRCNIVRDSTSQEPPTPESVKDCRLMMERGQREKKLINVLPFDLNELPCSDD